MLIETPPARRRISPRLFTLLAGVAAIATATTMYALRNDAPVPEPATAQQVAESTENAPLPPMPAPPELRTTPVEIRRNDTVIGALMRNDVSSATAHELVRVLRDAGADMRRVRPGDRLELSHEPDGRLVALVYAPSPWVRFEANVDGETWQAVRTDVQPDTRIEARHGEVRTSLWNAVEDGSVEPQVLLDLVRIFESDFDFTADTQPGDRFRLLVEARYADGKRVEHGRVLAAQYVSGDKTLTGIGFEADDRFSYYDPEGRSLRKMFLRSPLEFSRISSGFTYRRPHPVLGGVRPHLAVDYAAPTGTPVWAVADATVKFAGRNRGNGIQVVLRHRGGYETYYNHLSRIAKGVKHGAQVRQKQVIGYVGSTGLSTGPHLDYRVRKNGVFVNPLSEKFMPGDPVPAPHRARFEAHARGLVAQLERDAPFDAPGVTQ